MKFTVSYDDGRSFDIDEQGNVEGADCIVTKDPATGIMRVVNLDDDDRYPALTIDWPHLKAVAAQTAEQSPERLAAIEADAQRRIADWINMSAGADME